MSETEIRALEWAEQDGASGGCPDANLYVAVQQLFLRGMIAQRWVDGALLTELTVVGAATLAEARKGPT